MYAIIKIKEAMLRTNRVEPDIRDNDKTPSWDGELRLYTEEKFQKTQLCGKIPVQVKGKGVSEFNDLSIKYNVEISDLKNYKEDGGVIFFVVHINDYDNYRIYYKSLLPYDLQKLLLNLEKNQKTKSIELTQFPHQDPNEMKRILWDFIHNKKKQGTLLPNVFSMANLKNLGIEIENFEFSIPTIGMKSKEDFFAHLLASSPYIYMKPKGISASFAIDKVCLEQISENYNDLVIVNGETLYECISIIRTSNATPHFKIGKGITFKFGTDKVDFCYENTGTLKEQIKQMKFICALLQNQNVRIGELSLKDLNLSFDYNNVTEAKNRLMWLEKLDLTLQTLHVEKDLNLDQLSEPEINKLYKLIEGILDGKPIPFNTTDKSGMGLLAVGNINIIFLYKQYDSENLFYISNLFNSRDTFLSLDGESVSVSPYIIFKKDDFSKFDNINFKQIAESVQSFPYTELYGGQITQFVLELLKFYDSQQKQDDFILDVAEILVSFILKNSKNNEDLNKINLLQIFKRRRPLTLEENKYLISLKQKESQYQLAANILLESFAEAEIIYEKLDKEIKNQFEDYPIFSLWQKNRK
jgi:hypothetical protein